LSTLTLRVPAELEDSLERQSAALGISKSDLAREALKRYLQVTEFRMLRTKLVPHAQARDVHTDEEVFAALRKK
jgi:predicted DNA-binding protein